jgi:hypothetical protein
MACCVHSTYTAHSLANNSRSFVFDTQILRSIRNHQQVTHRWHGVSGQHVLSQWSSDGIPMEHFVTRNGVASTPCGAPQVRKSYQPTEGLKVDVHRPGRAGLPEEIDRKRKSHVRAVVPSDFLFAFHMFGRSRHTRGIMPPYGGTADRRHGKTKLNATKLVAGGATVEAHCVLLSNPLV